MAASISARRVENASITFSGHARDLEPPVGVGLFDPVAEFAEPPRQFVAVDRADELLGAVERFVGHGSPFAVLRPGACWR